MSSFPVTRLRRLRRTAALRDLVRETRLDLDAFVLPLFVAPDPLPNEQLPAMSRSEASHSRRRAAGSRAIGSGSASRVPSK